MLGTSKDANITMYLGYDYNGPMNEYIPCGVTNTFSSSFLVTNLLVLSKIDPDKEWTAADKANVNLNVEYLSFRHYNNDNYFITSGLNRQGSTGNNAGNK